MQVTTQLSIYPFGNHRMVLFDNTNGGAEVAVAERADETTPWTVSADGVPDVTAVTRPLAITALIDQALAALPGTGYSTFVPDVLHTMP